DFGLQMRRPGTGEQVAGQVAGVVLGDLPQGIAGSGRRSLAQFHANVGQVLLDEKRTAAEKTVVDGPVVVVERSQQIDLRVEAAQGRIDPPRGSVSRSTGS